METSSAIARRFCSLLLCCSVVVHHLANRVECGNNARHESSSDNIPQGCTYDEESRRVNCTNAQLKEVPKLPTDIFINIRSLILDGNEFRELKEDSFQDLRHLQNLSLRNCQIRWLHKDVFFPFQYSLRMIWLSNNPLNITIDEFLFRLRNVEYVDLSSTDQFIYDRSIAKLSTLKYFILSNNFITNFSVDELSSSLILLDLSNNHLRQILVSRKPEREIKLVTLILRANAIQILRNNSFHHLRNLTDVDLSNNPLWEIQPLAFRSNSLTTINLCKTKFRLDEGNWKIFHEAPNIERINMSFSRIGIGNWTNIVFHNFRNLADLDLSGTGISSTAHMFANLPNLVKLQLSHNPISTLNISDFEGIKNSLRELTVFSANLSTITSESLPLKVWENMRLVDFSDNPFICDGNFTWLCRWLKRASESGVEVQNWDRYHCKAPKDQLKMLELDCHSASESLQEPIFGDSYLLTARHRYQWHFRKAEERR